MKFALTIDCGNDAFCDSDGQCTIDSAKYEIARILKSISIRIDENGLSGMFENIKDINGNIVGKYAIKPNDYFKG